MPGRAARPAPHRPTPAGQPGLGERIHRLLTTPKAWTTARIWRALGHPPISLRTTYQRIREQARWCRPRLIAKSDPDHDQTCANIRGRIAALPPGSVVLAEDETHLDLLAHIRACWMPTGLRHHVMTPGTNVRRTIHGTVNRTTGTWHHHVSVQNVSVVFCYLLDLLLAAYPDAPIVAVICDNGSTHHSGITNRWLADHPRLLLIEGARYSPQDNPVERIWAALNVDGLEKALAGLGLLNDALALDLRKPQDYFHRIWNTAFRTTDLAHAANDEHDDGNASDKACA
jgi:hypothetical protein